MIKKILFACLIASLSSCVVVIGDEDVDNEHVSVSVSNNHLADRIEDLIDDDPSIDIYDLDVTAKEGSVFLRGETDSVADMQKAIDIAMTDSGVEHVRSYIVVNFYKNYTN